MKKRHATAERKNEKGLEKRLPQDERARRLPNSTKKTPGIINRNIRITTRRQAPALTVEEANEWLEEHDGTEALERIFKT